MSPLNPGNPLIVTVTGAAGQIAYSLLPLIASGKAFGSHQPVHLQLLEIPPALPALNGVVMELEDMAKPILRKVVATSDPKVAFCNADVVILVGAFPRRAGMDRRDLMSKNVPIFTAQARVIAEVASPGVLVLVVGNPALTNAMVLSHAAPSIPARNITALSRLDHNRAIALVARRCHVSVSDVCDVVIWGNHSSNMYPDFTRATICGQPAVQKLGGLDVLTTEIIPTIQKRGSSVIEARGASSALSAAIAIVDHLRSWIVGDDNIVTMAVPSDGSYGVKKGVWFSFPVRCPGGGSYEIVNGLEVNDFSQSYFKASKDELYSEKAEAAQFLKWKSTYRQHRL